MSDVKNTIVNGKAVLGIEFGSTRIKAVLIDENNAPIASEHTIGKTVWKMESGLILWKISGPVCRTAIGR